jgi:hypothetical protein
MKTTKNTALIFGKSVAALEERLTEGAPEKHLEAHKDMKLKKAAKEFGVNYF